MLPSENVLIVSARKARLDHIGVQTWHHRYDFVCVNGVSRGSQERKMTIRLGK